VLASDDYEELGSEKKPRLSPALVCFAMQNTGSKIVFVVDGSACGLGDVSNHFKFMLTDSDMVCHALSIDR
jgi:hypothetical protein